MPATAIRPTTTRLAPGCPPPGRTRPPAGGRKMININVRIHVDQLQLRTTRSPPERPDGTQDHDLRRASAAAKSTTSASSLPSGRSVAASLLAACALIHTTPSKPGYAIAIQDSPAILRSPDRVSSILPSVRSSRSAPDRGIVTPPGRSRRGGSLRRQIGYNSVHDNRSRSRGPAELLGARGRGYLHSPAGSRDS